MARIRFIHPDLATDEAFVEMSIAAKAAWPLLWTQCDDHGVFEWKPRTLKMRMLPGDDVNMDQILTEFLALNVVQQFEENGAQFGVVRNFAKFQTPKYPTFRYPFPVHLHKYAAWLPEMEERGFRKRGKGAPKQGNGPEHVPDTSPTCSEHVPEVFPTMSMSMSMSKKESIPPSSLRSDVPPQEKSAEPKPKRREQVPADWTPSERDRNFAVCHMPEEAIDREAAQFVSHHRGRGTVFRDISLAWQTWCRNCSKWGTARPSTAQPTKRTNRLRAGIDYDPAYYAPNPPQAIAALPEPQDGTPDHQAWQAARWGYPSSHPPGTPDPVMA